MSLNFLIPMGAIVIFANVTDFKKAFQMKEYICRLITRK